MRPDTVVILVGLGFVPLVDFVATMAAGRLTLVWLNEKVPQPTEKEIDAAAPGVYAARKAAQVRVAVARSAVEAFADAILHNPGGSDAAILADTFTTLKRVKDTAEAMAEATTGTVVTARVVPLPPIRRRL